MKILEHNVETGKVIERDLTKVELDQHKKDELENAAKIAEIQAKAIAKIAILERLGITDDEAKLLLS